MPQGMAWKETSPVEQRRQFILEVVRLKRGRTRTFAGLCAHFGISEKTGRKWRARFALQGAAGLADVSRRPHGNSRSVPGVLVARFVALKRRYPHWGPKTLREVYARRHPGARLPASSTIGDALKRAGLVEVKRRKRREALTPEARARLPLRPPSAPNDVWCIDFKGQFRLRDGRLCYPLTVTDDFSRMLLEVRAFHAIDMAEVKRVLQRLFARHGLPSRLRSDNGSPFGSGTGLAGLTQLSAWLLSLGVRPELSRPATPGDNARHERMHRTLKRECCRPAAPHLAAQQRAFNAFRRRFNHVRPHQGLGMKRPAELWHPSERALPRPPPSPSYPLHWEVRRVRPNGCVRWAGAELYVTAALVRRLIGFEPLTENRWLVRYYGLNLGVLAGKKRPVLRPYPRRRPEPMSPV
jgi:transposase InsO family protein